MLKKSNAVFIGVHTGSVFKSAYWNRVCKTSGYKLKTMEDNNPFRGHQMQTLWNFSRIRISVFLLTCLAGLSAAVFSQNNPSNSSDTPPDIPAAGIRILHSGADIQLNEGGASERYAVVLCTKPEEDVILSLFTHTEIVLSQTELAFTPANWNTPQVVTLCVPDNSRAEAARTRSITHTSNSLDPEYTSLPDTEISFTVTDNDTPALLITQSGSGTLLNEGLGEDTLTMQLSTAPLNEVNVILDTGLQITTEPSRLCFSPRDWSSPRVITLKAADDLLIEGTHTETVSYTVISADPEYDGLGVSEICVQITDNDTPGLMVCDPSGTGTISSPDGLTLDIRLPHRPSADVHIDIPSCDCVALSASSLDISPSEWDTTRNITLHAGSGVCGSGCLSFRLKSQDPAFDGLEVPSFIFTTPSETFQSADGSEAPPNNTGNEPEDYPVTTSKGLGSGCFVGALR